jgi:hypothetical protein
MAISPKFATGKYAWGICDRCGISARLHDLRVETQMGRSTNLKTCPSCWDPDHPQNFLPKFVQNDPQALRGARPDTGDPQSQQLIPPGNWINGQPPTPEQRVKWQLEIDAEHERQRVLWAQEMEAQRLRQRSF